LTCWVIVLVLILVILVLVGPACRVGSGARIDSPALRSVEPGTTDSVARAFLRGQSYLRPLPLSV
jgi:hypothetical protein